jgi:hypothetical protein
MLYIYNREAGYLAGPLQAADTVNLGACKSY